MFSWYKYLIVSLVFSHLGFWSGNLFLIAPFPDLCLLVPFFEKNISLKDKQTALENKLTEIRKLKEKIPKIKTVTYLNINLKQ